MPIVGVRPETGVRIDLERPREGGFPWRYVGSASTPCATYALRAVIDAQGAVTVDLEVGAPIDLAERARLLLRAVFRHARGEGAPPPRRVVRWRPDR